MTWDTMALAEQSTIRRWQWHMLLLALVCEIFLAADWYALAAVLPFISEALQLNEQQAGFAQGIFALTYCIGMIVWSPISRRMSARRMLLIGLAGTGLGMVLQTFVQSYEQLVALRLFIGFCDAAIFIGNMKLIFGWYPQAKRGSMVGLILAAYSLAITLVFALGIPLTLATSWRFFFGVLAAGTVLMTVLVALFARNDPQEVGFPGYSWGDEAGAERKLGFSEVFRSRWIAIGGAGIAACTFAIAGTATWVVPGFIAVQGMPVEYAPVIGTLMGLSQVGFLVWGGYVADKVEKTTIIKLSAVLAIAVALLFTASMIYPMPFVALVGLAAISGVAVFGGGAIFALMSERYEVALAPAAVGYAEIFGIIGSFIAPWMMGSIIHHNAGSFWQAFLAFAAVEVLLLVLLMVLVPRGLGLSAQGVRR
jgi:predicted MFS family arabinose efflux permease